MKETTKKKKRTSSADAEGGKAWNLTPRKDAGFVYNKPLKFGGPKLDKVMQKSVSISASSSPDSEILTFKFSTGPHEVARFMPMPISLRYVMKVTTPKRAVVAGVPWANADKPLGLTADPEKNNFRIYIDPFSPAQAFFDSAWLVVDNEDITLLSRGDRDAHLGGFAANAQRCFMTSEERKKWYNETGIVRDTGDWTKLAQGETVKGRAEEFTKQKYDFNQEQKDVLRKTDFGLWSNPEPRVIRLGIEGVPFLSYPRNFIMSKLTGEKQSANWGFLPPNTSVIVQLRRTLPHQRNLEQVTIPYKLVEEGGTENLAFHDVADDEYFSNKKVTVAPSEVTTTIEDIKLEMEVLKFDPSVASKMLAKFDRPVMNYVFDAHDMQIQRVPAGQNVAKVSFSVDKNVKLAVVNFAYQNNVFYNKESNHNCSYRATMPEGISKLSFTFMGEPLITEEFTQLENLNQTLSGETYNRYLEQRGLLDKDNPHYFPEKGLAPYRMYFPLDLTTFSPDGPRELEVTMTFTSGSASPEGLLVLCDKIYESTLTRLHTQGKKDWIIKPGISTSLK